MGSFPIVSATASRTLSLLSFLSLFCVNHTSAAERSPDSGIYGIWYKWKPEVIEQPFVKGGQIFLLWADCEPKQGQYDWAQLDSELEAAHEKKIKVTLDFNGDRKPVWLYEQVAVNPTAKYDQVWDKQGILQYWDPIHIEAYCKFIRAYARHLRRSPYRESILAVRFHYNAIGTEYGRFRPEEIPLSQWKPAPNGHIYEKQWTPEIYQEYRQTIFNTYIDACDPPKLPLLLRCVDFQDPIVSPRERNLLETGKAGMFLTFAEIQPRHYPALYQNLAFIDYCRTGQTLGYSESLGDAWGRHMNTTDPMAFSPAQSNYWRLLADMDMGASFLAVYARDLLAAEEDPAVQKGIRVCCTLCGMACRSEKIAGGMDRISRRGSFARRLHHASATRSTRQY